VKHWIGRIVLAQGFDVQRRHQPPAKGFDKRLMARSCHDQRSAGVCQWPRIPLFWRRRVEGEEKLSRLQDSENRRNRINAMVEQ